MRLAGLVGIAIITLLDPATSADGGCEKFAWPIARELAWFAASDKPNAAVGETLAALPKQALVIHLKPASQASFELPPERKPLSDQWFGGIVRFPALERPGIYQVTLSDEAWIDVIQDSHYARSVGSSGRNDCAGLRKSVRLEVGPMPFTLQFSGVSSDAIVMAIRPAE